MCAFKVKQERKEWNLKWKSKKNMAFLQLSKIYLNMQEETKSNIYLSYYNRFLD